MAARRGKKRALIAIGHSILKSAYHILNDNVSYKELGADYLNEKTEAKRKKYLQEELKKLGYEVHFSEVQLKDAGTEQIKTKGRFLLTHAPTTG